MISPRTARVVYRNLSRPDACLGISGVLPPVSGLVTYRCDLSLLFNSVGDPFGIVLAVSWELSTLDECDRGTFEVAVQHPDEFAWELVRTAPKWARCGIDGEPSEVLVAGKFISHDEACAAYAEVLDELFGGWPFGWVEIDGKRLELDGTLALGFEPVPARLVRL